MRSNFAVAAVFWSAVVIAGGQAYAVSDQFPSTAIAPVWKI